MPSLLEAAGKGQLRVFGNGKNKVSFTYLDNYCHGLILGYDALYKVFTTSILMYCTQDACSRLDFVDALD